MLYNLALTALALPAVLAAYKSEYKPVEGLKGEHVVSPRPHEYTDLDAMPKDWNWANINGTSLVTKSLNQHIPQYCGSCWAHGAISSLADRIKIARKGVGADINLSVQYILNCGSEAGSCYGGDHVATFEFIKNKGYVPYDTCNPYLACSSDSEEGICGHVDTKCNAMNTCRTCSTFSESGGVCNGIDVFPNASIAEYGSVRGVKNIQAEIYQRGPIACGIDAEPVLKYEGGVYTAGGSTGINHVISVTGWGHDEEAGDYWWVRNSWGEYWGELGYIRLGFGQLGIEDECAWATPAAWTEHNFPCWEDGTNCMKSTDTAHYVDPSEAL